MGLDLETSSLSMSLPRDGDDAYCMRLGLHRQSSLLFASESSTSNRVRGSSDSTDTSSASSSSPRSLQLSSLSSRIKQDEQFVLTRSQRLRRPHNSTTAFLRSIVSVFRPSAKQHSRLRQMKVLAEIAARRRSMVVLSEARECMEKMEGDWDDDETSSSSDSGRTDADDVLAEDCLHHVLNLQTEWLEMVLEMSKAKKFRGGYSHMPLEQYLAQFVDRHGQAKVPCAMDRPTVALARFEKLVNRQELMPTAVKDAFDRLCRHTIEGKLTIATRVWEDRDACEVMQSLVEELTEIISHETNLPTDLCAVLREFVEQMVFGRLASACYKSASSSIQEQHTQWREQASKCGALDLQQSGLRASLCEAASAREDLFAATIEAFDELPHLVPTSMLTAFVNAIQLLHIEAEEELGVPAHELASDVLLPLLVYVLSRCDLPYLHAQLHVMEQFADESSEIAFFLTSMRAAMAFLTDAGQAM